MVEAPAWRSRRTRTRTQTGPSIDGRSALMERVPMPSHSSTSFLLSPTSRSLETLRNRIHHQCFLNPALLDGAAVTSPVHAEMCRSRCIICFGPVVRSLRLRPASTLPPSRWPKLDEQPMLAPTSFASPPASYVSIGQDAAAAVRETGCPAAGCSRYAYVTGWTVVFSQADLFLSPFLRAASRKRSPTATTPRIFLPSTNRSIA